MRARVHSRERPPAGSSWPPRTKSAGPLEQLIPDCGSGHGLTGQRAFLSAVDDVPNLDRVDRYLFDPPSPQPMNRR
jgi:hypothetical protein